MTTPAILAYVPGTDVPGMDTVGIIPDFTNNRLYCFRAGGDPADGVSQFTGYVSGDVSLQRKLSQMGAQVTYINTSGGAAACLTYGGDLVFISSASSNSVTLAALHGYNLQTFNSFGTEGSETTPSGSALILEPYSIVPMRAGLVDWIVTTSAALNPGEVCVLTMPGMALTNLGNTTEARAVAGRGPVGSMSGGVFVVGRVAAGSFPSTAAFGLYTVSVTLPSVSPALSARIGTVSPAQVDATWTHFSDISAPAYDQTDGNPIIHVATTDVVTNQHYFIKLDASTAAVLWACPVNAYNADADSSMPRHNIVNQTLYYLGASHVLYTINTSTGVATSATIANLGPSAGQVSEDVNRSLITNVDWSDGGTTPTYLGTYMGAEGHHTLSTQWARWIPDGPFIPPPQPPPPDPPIDGAAVVSINRAFSYILDGHTFYVLDLGAQGTFAYDFVTEQWSNFSTGTLATAKDAPNPQWNFANGCMWGQRIVGGDLSTTDVWEMVPSAVLDNDAVNIGHAVTGGLSTRSRTYLAVSSVRIAASFGLIDEVSGTTFNLRFSDDQGNTWSPYYSITLTSGSYDSEIAWRSLGSFASPGRVFELTDSGGLVRIDGCDAFIDGFDEDTKAEPDNG